MNEINFVEIKKTLNNNLEKLELSYVSSPLITGSVVAVGFTMIQAYLPDARLGDICEIGEKKAQAVFSAFLLQ